jgi:solute carrier family 39 (zinc transporter), member 1/2/3
MHTHATHGHSHGASALVAAVGGAEGDKEHALRHRVIAQVTDRSLLSIHSCSYNRVQLSFTTPPSL